MQKALSMSTSMCGAFLALLAERSFIYFIHSILLDSHFPSTLYYHQLHVLHRHTQKRLMLSWTTELSLSFRYATTYSEFMYQYFDPTVLHTEE